MTLGSHFEMIRKAIDHMNPEFLFRTLVASKSYDYLRVLIRIEIAEQTIISLVNEHILFDFAYLDLDTQCREDVIHGELRTNRFQEEMFKHINNGINLQEENVIYDEMVDLKLAEVLDIELFVIRLHTNV